MLPLHRITHDCVRHRPTATAKQAQVASQVLLTRQQITNDANAELHATLRRQTPKQKDRSPLRLTYELQKILLYQLAYGDVILSVTSLPGFILPRFAVDVVKTE